MLSENGSLDRKEILKNEIQKIFCELEFRLGDNAEIGSCLEAVQAEIDQLGSRLEQDLASIRLTVLGSRISFEGGDLRETFEGIENANQWAINEWNRTKDERFYKLAERTYDLMDLLEELKEIS